MANSKIVTLGHATGRIIYAIIMRLSDSHYLNTTNGDFCSNIEQFSTICNNLVEGITIRSIYMMIENRTVWSDGVYLVMLYEQQGVTPTNSDTFVKAMKMYVQNDKEITLLDLQTTSPASPMFNFPQFPQCSLSSGISIYSHGKLVRTS